MADGLARRGDLRSRLDPGAECRAPRLFARNCVRPVHHTVLSRAVGGLRIDLLRAGTIDATSMRRAMIGEEDLKANLRATPQSESLVDVKRVVVECHGKMTFGKEMGRDRGQAPVVARGIASHWRK